jgi:type IV pilus assembly protein PilM
MNKKTTPKNNRFYRDRPLFGFDIGFSSMKIMQIDADSKDTLVTGYGVSRFDAAAIDKDGTIIDIETLAKSAKKLFEQNLIGEITTPRVAMSIPAARTFLRMIKLPKMDNKELAEAVLTEAEQYIPVPIDDLYMDYMITDRSGDEIELLAVAVPKKIVDSYFLLARTLGLETVAMEPTIAATTRLFVRTELSDVPTVLVDFGSVSSDITIYDKTLVVTGTARGGGDDFTKLIADKLKVSKQEALIIKSKYGLSFSKRQKEITEALTPTLDQLLKEIRRMIRYYEERYQGDDRRIRQLVTMGGGANMPGLSDFMTNSLRMPVRMSDPWHHVSFGRLQPPNETEKSMYITVAGLAMMKPSEIFE